MIFLFTHTHTKQVTDALGSTLSKTREGGDLVFFFAVIPPRLLEVLFLGFRCVLLGRKSVVQSLQWEVRMAVGWRLGRRPRGSVGEALAGLLPATGRAPEVPVLHAVYLPALSALSPRLPVTQMRTTCSAGGTGGGGAQNPLKGRGKKKLGHTMGFSPGQVSARTGCLYGHCTGALTIYFYTCKLSVHLWTCPLAHLCNRELHQHI